MSLIVVGGMLIALTSRKELHLFFNGFVSTNANSFFIYSTYLGDGYFIIGCLLMLLFYNFRIFLAGISAYSFSSLLVQILKNLIFPEAERPRVYFENVAKDTKLILIDGIETLGLHSFPSGHTTAAFSLMITFALIQKNPLVKTIFMFIAVLVGISRIYLSQHFFEDVYTGMIIGTLFAYLSVYYFYFTKTSSKYERLEVSVFNLYKKKVE